MLVHCLPYLPPFGRQRGAAAHLRWAKLQHPEAWAIVDGKLYLTHNQYWLQVWREKAEEYIRRDDASWQAVAELSEPVIVHRRATLRRFSADDQGRAARRWALGRRRRGSSFFAVAAISKLPKKSGSR